MMLYKENPMTSSVFMPRIKKMTDILPHTLQRIQETRGDFILWVGHNTFLVRTGEQYWLTDPIFSKRALIPKRKTPPALTLKELKTLVRAPNIIISHNHYDHLDRGSIEVLPEASRVFVPKGLAAMVKKMNKSPGLKSWISVKV